MEVDVTATVPVRRGNLVRFGIDLYFVGSCELFQTVVATCA